MFIAPEIVEVGKCFLTSAGSYSPMRRVVSIAPSRRAVFEARRMLHHRAVWTPGEQSSRSLAASVEREVPCDWTPEQEE
jgi:hypothetical protein